MCKYVYDSARNRLLRITDTGLIGKLKKELLAMINPATHEVSLEATAVQEGMGGGGTAAGGKGPAMSDSDSADQMSDEEEEDGEERRESAGQCGEAGEGGGREGREQPGCKRALNFGVSGVEVGMGMGWEGDEGGIPVVSASAGGYLSALEFEKASKPSTLSWSSMKLAPEAEVAGCMQKLPRICVSGALALSEAHKGHYARWHTELHAGFNLCFYGFGSKRALLRDFAQTKLKDGAVVEINGFMPGLKLKKVLATISEDLLHEKRTFRSLRAHAVFVAQVFTSQLQSELMY